MPDFDTSFLLPAVTRAIVNAIWKLFQVLHFVSILCRCYSNRKRYLGIINKQYIFFNFGMKLKRGKCIVLPHAGYGLVMLCFKPGE